MIRSVFYTYRFFGSIVALMLLFCLFQGPVFAQEVTMTATVPAICGNAAIEGAEACDDGNTADGDGCSSLCAVENNDGAGAPGAGQAANAAPAGDNNQQGEGEVPQDNPEPPVVPDEVPEEVEDPIEEVPPEEEPDPEPAPEEQVAEEVVLEEGPQDAQDAGEDAQAEQGQDAAPEAGQGDNNNQPAAGNNAGGGGGGAAAPSSDQAAGEDEIIVWIAGTSLAMPLVDNTIQTFAGDRLRIGIRPFSRIEAVDRVFVQLNDGDISFTYNAQTERYEGVLRAPQSGRSLIRLRIRYADGVMREASLTLEILGRGVVRQRGEGAIAGARVGLYDAETFALVDLSSYGQENPVQTGEQGIYGFLVPNGSYFLRVEKEGFRVRETPTFRARSAVINDTITLIEELPALTNVVTDILNSNKSTEEKAVLVASALKNDIINSSEIALEVAQDVVRKVNEVADDPVVEEAVEEVVTPVAAGAATAVVVPSLGGNLFPFLRYLFLQPLLLLGRRKRKAWGVVYNSLTKLPVDLAIIRLIDTHTGRVVQSRVTDSEGRFLFLADKGEYRVEVRKPGFDFPSTLLQGAETDGEFTDVYHGEDVFSAADEASITPNIPLDPKIDAASKTPERIIRERRITWLRELGSISGVVMAGISFYISPTWFVGCFLVLHLFLYGLFHRLAKQKKPKSWGLVRESASGQPIGQAVVRLFSRQYNKLIATQVTDRKGRYAFLVGPNTYYIASEKQGYQGFESDDIVVEKQGEKGILLQQEIGLTKSDS